jgi:putative membrane protein
MIASAFTSQAANATAQVLQAHPGPDGGWGHDSPFPFFLIPLLVWAALIFFIFGWRRRWHSPEHSAERVLAENYARGEVTEQEYRQRRAVLREVGRRRPRSGGNPG